MGTSRNHRISSGGHGIVDLQKDFILINDMTGDLTSAFTVNTTSILCEHLQVEVVINQLSIPSSAEKGHKACPYKEIGNHKQQKWIAIDESPLAHVKLSGILTERWQWPYGEGRW